MGCIQVSAPGVVIRNSKISCNGFYAVASFDGSYSGTPLLLEDSEIDCQNLGGTAISEANVTARRLNIHGCENGLNISQNVTVEDSYIHDMYNSAEAHTDGIQFAPATSSTGRSVPGVAERDDPPQHHLRDGLPTGRSAPPRSSPPPWRHECPDREQPPRRRGVHALLSIRLHRHQLPDRSTTASAASSARRSVTTALRQTALTKPSPATCTTKQVAR